jgi:hypothetical protein
MFSSFFSIPIIFTFRLCRVSNVKVEVKFFFFEIKLLLGYDLKYFCKNALFVTIKNGLDKFCVLRMIWTREKTDVRCFSGFPSLLYFLDSCRRLIDRLFGPDAGTSFDQPT